MLTVDKRGYMAACGNSGRRPVRSLFLYYYP